MVKPTSFKLAAGLSGIATLAKLSAFAAALMLIGAGPGRAGSLGRPCTATQSQWLSIETLQSMRDAQGRSTRNADRTVATNHDCRSAARYSQVS